MMKKYISAILIFVFVLSLTTGCTQVKSQIKDIKAETFGIRRTFDVYDDFGNKTLSVTGDSTDMQPSEVDNVILITIDGYTWQHVGSTMVVSEDGLINAIADSEGTAETADWNTASESGKETQTIDTTKNASGTLTTVDRFVNNVTSNLVGLKRVIFVKNQMGVLVGVYEGDKVLVEDSSLPDSTKILIDDKRLTLYRCDFEIFEAGMLNQ
jgi:S-adenosylmethionine hydrolase